MMNLTEVLPADFSVELVFGRRFDLLELADARFLVEVDRVASDVIKTQVQAARPRLGVVRREGDFVQSLVGHTRERDVRELLLYKHCVCHPEDEKLCPHFHVVFLCSLLFPS